MTGSDVAMHDFLKIALNFNGKDVELDMVQTKKGNKSIYSTKMPDGHTVTITQGKHLSNYEEGSRDEYKIVRTAADGISVSADLVGSCGA